MPYPETQFSSLNSQLIAYGYSAVAQSVADATGAATDMMPSAKLSELIQIAKEKSNTSIRSINTADMY